MTCWRLVVGAVVLAAVIASGCALLDYGTQVTAATIENTCHDEVVARMRGERWEQTTEDQLKGELVTPGETRKVVAVNPHDDDEGLVLRLSPPDGSPISVLRIERNRNIDAAVSSVACASIRGNAPCRLVLQAEPSMITCE
jgi:hypothetical protein